MHDVRPTQRNSLLAFAGNGAARAARAWRAAPWALLIGLTCREAVAAPEPDPGEPAKGAATADMDFVSVAIVAYRKGKYAEAKAAFDSAWRIKPSGAIAAMLAEVEMKLGRHELAAYHWSYAKSHLPEDSDAFKQAVSGLDTCRLQVGTLRLKLSPAHAVLLVDDRPAEFDEKEMQAWVLPGKHAVRATVPPSGFSEPLKLEIQAGEARDVALSVVAAPEDSKVSETTASKQSVVVTAKNGEEAVRDAGVRRPTEVLIAGGALTLTALGLGAWFGLKGARTSTRSRIFRIKWTARQVQAG